MMVGDQFGLDVCSALISTKHTNDKQKNRISFVRGLLRGLHTRLEFLLKGERAEPTLLFGEIFLPSY